MPETVEMDNPAESYVACIKAAFIEPIRSVTVVDDEYPTIDRLLDFSENQLDTINETDWKANIDRLKSVITLCREEENSWSLDVYDGTHPSLGEDISFSPHINHSDLLILDYHLDEEGDEGERARNILQALAENNHFNLIIVHTKGHAGDIKKVFEDILKDFIEKPNISAPSGDLNADEIEEQINDWFDEHDDDGNIQEILTSPIDFLSVLPLFQDGSLVRQARNPRSPLSSFQEYVAMISGSNQVTAEQVNWWIVNKQYEYFHKGISDRSHNVQDWGYEDEVNWIATGKTFITVIRKEDNTTQMPQLPTLLQNALQQYNPPPMLLLMARMRYELDECGLEEALNITNDKYAQAGWLFKLLKSENAGKFAYEKAIDLHWGLIADATKKNLNQYAETLIQALKQQESSPKDIVKSFYDGEIINNHIKAKAHMNAYSCSKKVSREHLTTGHILYRKAKEPEYWVCLSPACDMVPGQNEERDWNKRMGVKNMPFKAVKLTPIKNDTTAVGNANRNTYLFLNIEDDIKYFSYPDPKDNPNWEVMFADNEGRLDKNLNVGVRRLSSSEAESLLITEIQTFKVISELRYEYALNLLHRFSANQSRVGLDFIDKLWDQ